MTEKLSVKVKPGSRQQKIKIGEDGVMTVWLKSPPVDGKANAELIKVLATRYHVSKSQVCIRGGGKSRLKRIEIQA